MAISEILRTCSAADDLDSAKAIAAFFNADGVMHKSNGNSADVWTVERVMRLGRVLNEYQQTGLRTSQTTSTRPNITAAPPADPGTLGAEAVGAALSAAG